MENEIVVVIEKKTNTALEIATDMIVTEEAHIKHALDYVKNVVKPLAKVINEQWNGGINDANKLYKKLIADRDIHLDPLKEAEAIVKKKIASCTMQIEADRKAEQEREQARIMKEHQAKLKSAEASITSHLKGVEDLTDRKNKMLELMKECNDPELKNVYYAKYQAIVAKIEGTQDAVEAAQDIAETPKAMSAPVEQVKIKGMAISKKYKGIVVDKELLLKAVLDKSSGIPMDIIKFDQVKINMLRKNGIQFPGVHFTEDKTIRI